MLEMVKIRYAHPRDAHAIAGVHYRAWQQAYRGIVPDEHLDHLDPEKGEAMWREILSGEVMPDAFHFVAEGAGGHVFAFSGGGPRREGPGRYDGELYAIYVEPEAQGKGVGTELFVESVRELRKRGFEKMLVWALEKASNQEFYRKMGGKAVDMQQVEIGKSLTEIAWGFDALELFDER